VLPLALVLQDSIGGSLIRNKEGRSIFSKINLDHLQGSETRTSVGTAAVSQGPPGYRNQPWHRTHPGGSGEEFRLGALDGGRGGLLEPTVEKYVEVRTNISP
jgi:hypothetical protein